MTVANGPYCEYPTICLVPWSLPTSKLETVKRKKAKPCVQGNGLNQGEVPSNKVLGAVGFGRMPFITKQAQTNNVRGCVEIYF